MSLWTSNIESTIFSRVKRDGTINLKSKYSDLYYTAENVSEDEPHFPTCYVQELPGTEIGQDLEGNKINGILSSFQIDVSDNKSKERVKEVMNQAILSMKEMRYEVTTFPIYYKEEQIWKSTARFRRNVGFNDIL